MAIMKAWSNQRGLWREMKIYVPKWLYYKKMKELEA